MENYINEILHGFSLIILYLFVFILSKAINNLLTPYSIDEELTTKDNTALSISLCGYLIATTIIFIGAALGPSKGIIEDLLVVGGYSLLGIILLNVSRFINDKIIFYKFSNVKEIIDDRNAGAGAVQFGSYIASGLIVAGSIHGEGAGIISALVFFALCQIALIIFIFIYNKITPFDIHEEIENDNVAAGVACGGTLIAVGIILMKGVSGNFVSWQHNLEIFGVNLGICFIILPLVRLFFDKVIIPRSDLNYEIKNDKNLGAGLLEMTVAVSFAVILFFVM